MTKRNHFVIQYIQKSTGTIPEELFTDYDSSVVEDVGQKIGKSDIWTHLSFYYNSFPGIYEELLYLIDFLRKLNEEHEYNPYVQNQNATLPFFGEVSEWKISDDRGICLKTMRFRLKMMF